ncbi:imidazole glycerol phosphate synthase subunit HisH [Ahrensia sp. R2A130]|uniref:imidazole glycerol phosphate synthase subunit HisH n=1 Tax=Ahrensia sp. R2A130 TaxID=744979 RepID=UPI0001E0B496|nr:imidazole glycerol phosphate synthase subunit HisH [Ahrensia sp. R2A130]EFL89715.1 imidazole glycerol phosphate synthase, glutamine amidotransferase subunit [Ahrensia sp. R2A130]
MTTAIIDYGSGNLRSATKAFERAAREGGTDEAIVLTADADTVRRADRIVLPGVGAYADCRAGLDAVPGMVDVLQERVRDGGVPFLGICVGMQLMAERGLEKSITPGLGWIKGDIALMEPSDPSLKIPQIGWNELNRHRDHALLNGIAPDLHAYFVHSYALVDGDDDTIIATTNHGGEWPALIAKDNMAGTQFHPEKSQTLGLALIANFLAWAP